VSDSNTVAGDETVPEAEHQAAEDETRGSMVNATSTVKTTTAIPSAPYPRASEARAALPEDLIDTSLPIDREEVSSEDQVIFSHMPLCETPRRYVFATGSVSTPPEWDKKTGTCTYP
jgi:hypothetical protein